MTWFLPFYSLVLLSGGSNVRLLFAFDLWDGSEGSVEGVFDIDDQAELLSARGVATRPKKLRSPRRSRHRHPGRHITPAKAEQKTPATMSRVSQEVETPNLIGKHVQILGLFDTGTNLLRALLEANFPEVVPYDMYNPPMEFWSTLDQPDCMVDGLKGKRMCSLWKHANLDIIKRLAPNRIADFEANDIIAIAMIREPMSWLQSIRKEGYDFAKNGNDPSKATWLSDHVTASKVWYGGEDVVYENLEEIWNNQTSSYERLSEYGFKRNLVIRYEDLVLDTESVMAEVAALLNLTVPSSIDQIERSAKSGNSTGHDEACEKITAKTYLSLFSQEDFSEACMRINMTLAARHNYTDCDRAFVEINADKVMS